MADHPKIRDVIDAMPATGHATVAPFERQWYGISPNILLVK